MAENIKIIIELDDSQFRESITELSKIAKREFDGVAKEILSSVRAIEGVTEKTNDFKDVLKDVGSSIASAFIVDVLPLDNLFTALWSLGPRAVTAFGIAGVAVLGFIGVLMNLKDETSEVSENVDNLVKKVQESEEAHKRRVSSIRDSAADEIAQILYIENLTSELGGLVDAEGKVAEANQGRAKFILNQLNGALGTELELIDGQIVGYEQLDASVEEMIETKKKEAYLNAAQEELTAQIREQMTIKREMKAVDDERNAILEKIKELEANNDGSDATLGAITTYKENLEKLDETYVNLEERQSNTYQAMGEIEAAMVEGFNGNMEGMMGQLGGVDSAYGQTAESVGLSNAAIVDSENTKAQRVAEALDQLKNDLISHTDLVGLTAEEQEGILRGQVNSSIADYEILRDALARNEKGITEDMVNQARDRAISAQKEFEAVGGQMTSGLTVGIAAGKEAVYGAGEALGEEATKGVKNKLEINSPSRAFNSIGQNIADSMSAGASSKSASLMQTMRGLASNALSAAKQALGIASPSKLFRDDIGIMVSKGFAIGIEDGTGDVTGAIEEQCEDILGTYIQDMDLPASFFDLGEMSADHFVSGFGNRLNIALNVARNAMAGFTEQLGFSQSLNNRMNVRFEDGQLNLVSNIDMNLNGRQLARAVNEENRKIKLQYGV